MQVQDIEIHTGDIARPYQAVRNIKAKVGASHVLSKTPTIEDVNFKLQGRS